MTDPYINCKSKILKNKLHITDAEILSQAESDFTVLRFKQLLESPLSGNFDFIHLCKIHEFLFQDIYDWAGKPRTINISKEERALGGLSILYSPAEKICLDATVILEKMNTIPWRHLSLDLKTSSFSECLSALWKVHPFREGNTRAITIFCCQLLESKGIRIDHTLFAEHSPYFRDALVAASAVFPDCGDLSKPEYLYRIIKDALQRGLSQTPKYSFNSIFKSEYKKISRAIKSDKNIDISTER